VNVKIKVGDKEVKQVDCFLYLGSTIHDQRNSEKEIVKRIGLAKKAWTKKKKKKKKEITKLCCQVSRHVK